MQHAAGEDAVPVKTDHRLVDKATQTTVIEAQNGHITPTEDYDDDSYELRRKIDMFQASLERSEVQNETHCPHCRSKIMTPENKPLANQESLYSETEDAVAQELAMLFGEEPTDLNHIFGIEPTAVTDDPQISAILKEIANAELPEKLSIHPHPQPPHHQLGITARWIFARVAGLANSTPRGGVSMPV